MTSHVLYFYILWSFICIQTITSVSQHPLILVVSFDGFRYDYLNRNLTPNLLILQSQGVYSDYMKNIFPTKTYPNHHSIATGLYAEQHGVIDNHVYDTTTNKTLHYSKELFQKKDVIPIYTLNELQGGGRYSGVMMWPGSDFKYQNHSITHNHIFERNSTWESRVDEAITWYLDKEKPANLIMLYFDQPDSEGHLYGSESAELNKQIKRCDNITKYLLDSLEKAELRDKVNLFVLSDHGMISLKISDLIDLTRYVNREDFVESGGSPTVEIFPVKDKEEEVYNKLSAAAVQSGKFQIFRKADMPERWHYKNSERAPPLLALANVPYAFQDLQVEYSKWFWERNRTVSGTVGLHGYDNTETSMYPLFIAHGPLLKKNTRVAVFNNIDLFPLWCEMLKLSPVRPGIQQSLGDIEQVRGLLRGDETSAASVLVTGNYLVLLPALVTWGLYRKK